jgi:dynein intermediate chain 2
MSDYHMMTCMLLSMIYLIYGTGFWDLRKGSSPVEMSSIDKSHRDPVYDVSWIQSRAFNECCSVSTDGQLLWWDIRKLGAGPTDSTVLASANDVMYGGTSIEYRSDAGATRYLVGTEQGVTVLFDRKTKKETDSQKAVKMTYGLRHGRHHGPVYSVQRNPFHTKYFLTVGDWSARIWMEDQKAPIMLTRYDRSYLTSACWSPTRPGVFFTTKMDGTMDVWDFYHKQSDPIFTTKLTDSSLCTIKVQQQGRLAALGSTDGSTTVVELSDALVEPQKEEKSIMAQVHVDRHIISSHHIISHHSVLYH